MQATGADDFTALRVATLAAGCVLAVLAVSGVLVTVVFTQPTTLKYLVTVAGSLLVVTLALARAPLKLLVGIAIVVAPFDFVTTVGSVQVTPLLAVDLLALLVCVTRSGFRGRSALIPATGVFVLLLAPAIAGSDTPATWILWLATTVVTGALVFLVAREPGGPLFVAIMIATSAVVQSVLALWEFRTGHQLNLYLPSGNTVTARDYFFTYGSIDRPDGALADPIGLGQVLALCLPVMVALAAAMRRWTLSVVVLAAAGLVAVALLLSLSRMSIVGAACGLVAVLLLLPRRAQLTTGLTAVAMVGVVAIVGLALAGRPLRLRIDSIFHPTAAHVYTAPGDLTRIRIWRAALKTAEANPVTGVGFGNVTKYLPQYGVPVTPAAHAHDTYLQYFAEGGVLGLVALLGLLAAAGIDLVRAFATHRIWVAGATGALLATTLAWLTDVEVRYVQVSAMVAVLLGLIAALAADAKRSPA